MKPAALVFDLDDTLYLERDFVLSGFEAADEWLWQQHGVGGFGAEAKRLFAAGVRGRIFDEALDRLGVWNGAELVPHLVAVYRAHRPRLTLLTEARWAIETFRGRLKLGLITDGYAQTQRNKVAALGLGGLLDVIVYTDELGRENWKPSPVPFRRMMEALGCAGKECIYVADNPAKDFLAPNGLDWLTIQIQREGGEYGGAAGAAVAPAYLAGRTIRSLRELGGIIG